jgi:oleate hydratase
VEKTNWESFTVTCRDPRIPDRLAAITGRDPLNGRIVTGGPCTIRDSSWLMTFTVSRQPHFRNQPPGVLVLWAYGLFSDVPGDHVRKTMRQCTGDELLSELLYHLGVPVAEIPDVVAATTVIPAMMPYITAQFMPRVAGDRPDVVPRGSVNLAFLGQFAEVPKDCVFTVEYSVRTAMTAVYELLHVDRAVPEVYPSMYDLRDVARASKTLSEDDPMRGGGLVRRFLGHTQFDGLV